VDAPLEIRAIGEDEFAEFVRVEGVAFGHIVQEADREAERTTIELDRTVAAFEGDDIVGTAAAYSFDLTLPGGGTIPVAGVTAVGVLPTHRRQGVLRAMMVRQLDDVAARGEPCAILNASEGAIYRRFGYGVASEFQTLEIDARRVRFAEAPPRARLRLLTQEEGRKVLPGIYEQHRLRHPGWVSRNEAWWGAILGEHQQWKGGGKLFVVIAEGGYVIYALQMDGDFAGKRLVVRELVGDDDVSASLWQYCFDVDLVKVVEVVGRPLDDPLRWRLADPRQVRVKRQQDYLWVRVLDVAAALSARSYAHDAELVLEVTDELRPEVAGRYRLAVTGGRADVERTDDATDLRLDAAALGSLYLSGVAPSLLARAGHVEERTGGALERADQLFRWPVQPECTTFF
jgi:predicted acetyltransferase